MSAHTPGPWFVTSQDDYPTGQVSTTPLGNGDICVVYNERAKADARLIAAAPELLRELRAAYRVIVNLPARKELAADIDKAIAKAEAA